MNFIRYLYFMDISCLLSEEEEVKPTRLRRARQNITFVTEAPINKRFIDGRLSRFDSFIRSEREYFDAIIPSRRKDESLETGFSASTISWTKKLKPICPREESYVIMDHVPSMISTRKRCVKDRETVSRYQRDRVATALVSIGKRIKQPHLLNRDRLTQSYPELTSLSRPIVSPINHSKSQRMEVKRNTVDTIERSIEPNHIQEKHKVRNLKIDFIQQEREYALEKIKNQKNSNNSSIVDTELRNIQHNNRQRLQRELTWSHRQAVNAAFQTVRNQDKRRLIDQLRDDTQELKEQRNKKLQDFLASASDRVCFLKKIKTQDREVKPICKISPVQIENPVHKETSFMSHSKTAASCFGGGFSKYQRVKSPQEEELFGDGEFDSW